MMKGKGFIVFVLILVSLLAACGPSAEEIATQTAAAWTATPPPPTETPTPTPIPYDLTVSVVDGEGNAIGGASIIFPESGDDAPVQADENGMVSWTNVSGEAANIEVSGQGYTTQSGPLTLTRGPNEATFTMERDALQLLASEICPAGQKAIYIEDFEDGAGQLLEGIGRPAWEYVTDDRGTYLSGDEQSQNRLTYQAQDYVNYVVHFDMLRPPDAEILWIRIREDCCPSSYIGVFSRDGNTWLQREGPNEPFWPGKFISRPDGETWEHVSLSVFEGAFDLWMNNELLLGITDPEPIGPGVVSIEITDHLQTFAIDNLAICSLDDLYQPVIAEEEGT